jgi:hypothetical protein
MPVKLPDFKDAHRMVAGWGLDAEGPPDHHQPTWKPNGQQQEQPQQEQEQEQQQQQKQKYRNLRS